MAVFHSLGSLQIGGTIFDAETGVPLVKLVIPPPGKVYNPKFPGHFPRPKTPAWSPDGSRIAAGYNDGIRGTASITASIVDATTTTNSSTTKLSHFNRIDKIAFWDARSGHLDKTVLYASPREESDAEVEFAPDGQTLIGRGYPLARFDARTGLKRPEKESLFPKAVGASVQEKLNLIAVPDKPWSQIQIQDLKSQRVLWRSQRGKMVMGSWQGDVFVAFDGSIPTSSKSASAKEESRALQIWDARQKKLLKSPPIPQDRYLHGVSLNPFGPWCSYVLSNLPLTGADSDELVVWDYQKGQRVWNYRHQQSMGYPVWSPDGRWLALYLANKHDGPNLAVFDRDGHKRIDDFVRKWYFKWSPDSKKLAVLSEARGLEVQIWKMPS